MVSISINKSTIFCPSQKIQAQSTTNKGNCLTQIHHQITGKSMPIFYFFAFLSFLSLILWAMSNPLKWSIGPIRDFGFMTFLFCLEGWKKSLAWVLQIYMTDEFRVLRGAKMRVKSAKSELWIFWPWVRAREMREKSARKLGPNPSRQPRVKKRHYISFGGVSSRRGAYWWSYDGQLRNFWFSGSFYFFPMMDLKIDSPGGYYGWM